MVLFYVFHDLSFNLIVLVEKISQLFSFSCLVHASGQGVIVYQTILDLNWALGVLKGVIGVEFVSI